MFLRRLERQLTGGGVRLPPAMPGERREMAGVPREQAEVVITTERPREILDELGLKRGAAVPAPVRGDRADEADVRHVPEQTTETVVALLADLLQERVRERPRHRVHGVEVGDEVTYRIEFAEGGQAAASGQGDYRDAGVDFMDGISADTGAAVLPQAHQLDLPLDGGLPVLGPRHRRPGRSRRTAWRPAAGPGSGPAPAPPAAGHRAR